MPATLLVAALLTGCASLDPKTWVTDAATLAKQQTGHEPEWNAPWDDAPPAWSDESVLKLEQALVMALRNNRELRGDLSQIGQANADLVQAGLLSNPVINFMVMFPSGGGRSMLRSNALPMQQLQDLWLIPAKKEVARAELQKAVVRAAQRAVELAAAVKRVYAEIQYAERSHDLVRANLELVSQSMDIIRARQSAGKASQAEFNLARIRHQRLRSELLSVEVGLITSKQELVQLMGVASGSVAWKPQALDESAGLEWDPPAEPVALELAADQRLDLKAAEWSVEAAERRVGLAHREGWPEMSAGFSFERAAAGKSPGVRRRFLAAEGAARTADIAGDKVSASDEARGALGRLATQGPRREVKWVLGPMFEMELPIFDWNQAQSARAAHELDQRIAEYEALLQTAIREVRRALARCSESRRQAQLFRNSILPEVLQNLELARQAYIGGQTDLTIYLQAQEDAISTRSRLLEYVRDLSVYTADLERAVGGSLMRDITTSQPVTAPKHAEASEPTGETFNPQESLP